TQHQRIVVPPTSTMKENPLAVPGTWNPGTNYADSRYQLPQIDSLEVDVSIPLDGYLSVNSTLGFI
ncbi:hypothetical protein ACL1IT_14880, partial [Corynebacterium striatum]